LFAMYSDIVCSRTATCVLALLTLPILSRRATIPKTTKAHCRVTQFADFSEVDGAFIVIRGVLGPGSFFKNLQCVDSAENTVFMNDAGEALTFPDRVTITLFKRLREAMQEYPDAANEIKAWVAIVEGVRWHNFAEVRLMFRDADYIHGYVVFNIRRNRYRLITVIHYAKTTDEKRTEGHVYIRSYLTHKEYNAPRKWDRRFGAK
jgi:mRNA interferase HigB